MFEHDWESWDDTDSLCAEVDPDGVAEWAASCPAPDAISTPFGELDPHELSRHGRLDALVALERQRAWIDFQQQRVLAEIATDPGDSPEWIAKNLVREEVACALRIPGALAEARLHTAAALTGQFPATLAALRAGDLSMLHARILVEATADLDEATAGEVEAAVLSRAVTQTAASFRRSVHRARARIAPRQAEAAHADALADRRVEPRRLPDGMGELRPRPRPALRVPDLQPPRRRLRLRPPQSLAGTRRDRVRQSRRRMPASSSGQARGRLAGRTIT